MHGCGQSILHPLLWSMEEWCLGETLPHGPPERTENGLSIAVASTSNVSLRTPPQTTKINCIFVCPGGAGLHVIHDNYNFRHTGLQTPKDWEPLT